MLIFFEIDSMNFIIFTENAVYLLLQTIALLNAKNSKFWLFINIKEKFTDLVWYFYSKL